MSYDELTAELKSLKKRLYTFKLKGMELHQRARNHISTHRAEMFGQGSAQEKEVDMKFAAFGPNPQSIPLSNEYILEMIAYHLPWKDLQNCKKVCKLWNEEMSRCEMKRKSIVVASDEDSDIVTDLVRQKTRGNLVSLSTLVILSTSLDTKPVQLVVNHFGTTLSSLRLDECTMTAQELYLILRDVPALDHLSVKSNEVTRRRNVPARRDGFSPLDQITSNVFTPTLVLHYLRELSWEDERDVTALERLPRMCPNLVSLQISNLGACQPDLFQNLNWKTLKVLDLKLGWNTRIKQINYFRSFSKMGLKLKSLFLKNIMPDGYNRMKEFKKFLECSKKSLEDLRITRPVSDHVEISSRLYSPFPVRMNSLKSLTIDMEFVTSLNIIDHLPVLEKLSCKCNYWINWWKILKKTTLPKVQRFINEVSLGAIDNDCLKKIIQAFPNILTLDITEDRVDDTLFSTICGNLPRLRILRIRSSINHNRPHLCLTDHGITGISQDECSKLVLEEDFQDENVESLRTQPNIRNLKELHILEINCAPKLSDLTLFHGLVGLPSLVVIHLPTCLITDASLQRFPNFQISRDPDGSRRIRVKATMNESVSTLLNLVADGSVMKNPLSLFGELVAELSEFPG